MYYITLFLSIIFRYIFPIIIIFRFNVILEDGGYDLNTFGLLTFIIVSYTAYKALEKRINIWDIQARNKTFRIIYGLLKMVLMSGLVWWIYETISKAYDTIHLTLMGIFFSVVLGALFRLWSLYLYHKKQKKVVQ